jgi:hypothetical protein
VRLGYRSPCVAALTSVALLAGASPAAAAPRNDDFAHARTLRVGTTVKGNINGATRQRGERRHADSLARRSVWYRFRAKRKVTLSLSTCRSTFDSVIAVYSGRSLRALREVDFNNDGCGRRGGGSRVIFTARRGRTYRIAVIGFTPRGKFRLKVASVPVPSNDDFADAARLPLDRVVAATTLHATREVREPRHNFRNAHTVWFRLSVESASVVRLDSCTRSEPGIAVYTGGRVNRLTPVPVATRTLDSHCSVQFAAQPGITYRLALENGDDGAGAFRLSGRLATPPANDNFADATPIALGATINATTRDATVERGEPEVFTQAATVWYQLALTDTTTVRLDECINNSVLVFTGPQVTQLIPESRYSGCPRQVTLEPGVYFIRVGTDELDFSFHTAPVTPPANDNFADAPPITLGTTVTGTTLYATRELFEPGSSPFTVWYRFNLAATTTVNFECGPVPVQLTDYAGVAQVTSVYCTAESPSSQEAKLPPGSHSIHVQSDQEVDFSFRAEAVTPPSQ